MNIRTVLTFGLYKPFNHDPKDFQLKLVPSWFSNDYIAFRYTANGGRSWKHIHRARPPYHNFLEYNWTWEDVTYQLSHGATFSYEKEKFSTYQKILDYEAQQEKEYYEGRANIEEERRKYYERRKKQMESINQ